MILSLEGAPEMTDIVPADYSNCLNIHEAMYRMITECDQEVHQYYQAIAMKESTYFAENGVDIVYEAADISGMIHKAIEIVKSWLGKIMGAISRFIQEFRVKAAAITKSLGINMEKLKAAKNINIKEFEDYDYIGAKKALEGTRLINLVGYSHDIDTIKKTADASDELSKQKFEEAKKWVGSGDEITTKNILKHFRGEKKVKFTNSNVHGGDAEWCTKIITDYKTAVDTVLKMQKDAKSAADSSIKELKKLERELGKKENGNDDAKLVHKLITTQTTANSYNTAYVSAAFTILLGSLSLAKRLAHGWIAGSKKSGKNDESPAKAKGSEETALSVPEPSRKESKTTVENFKKDIGLDDFDKKMKDPNYTFKF